MSNEVKITIVEPEKDKRKGYLEPQWWLTCCACLPVLGFIKGLICVIPCTVFYTCAVTGIYVGFIPMNIFYTVWSIFSVEGFGITFKFVAAVFMIGIICLFPVIAAIVAFFISFGTSLFGPISYTFDDNYGILFGGIGEIFKKCFCDWVKDAIDIDLVNYLDYCSEQRKDPPLPDDEVPVDIPLLQIAIILIKGSIFSTICALYVSFACFITSLIHMPFDLYYNCWTIIVYKGWGVNNKIILSLLISIFLIIYPFLIFPCYFIYAFFYGYIILCDEAINSKDNIFISGIVRMFTHFFMENRLAYVKNRYIDHFVKLEEMRKYVLPQGAEPCDIPLGRFFIGLITALIIIAPCTICCSFMMFGISFYKYGHCTIMTIYTIIVSEKLGPTMKFIVCILSLVGFVIIFSVTFAVSTGSAFLISLVTPISVYIETKTYCEIFASIKKICFVDMEQLIVEKCDEYLEDLKSSREYILPEDQYPCDLPVHILLLFIISAAIGIVTSMTFAILMIIIKFIPTLINNEILFWKLYFKMTFWEKICLSWFWILGTFFVPIGVCLGMLLFLLLSFAFGVSPTAMYCEKGTFDVVTRILNNLYDLDLFSNFLAFNMPVSMLRTFNYKTSLFTKDTFAGVEHYELYFIGIIPLIIIPSVIILAIASIIIFTIKLFPAIGRVYITLYNTYFEDDPDNDCCTKVACALPFLVLFLIAPGFAIVITPLLIAAVTGCGLLTFIVAFNKSIPDCFREIFNIIHKVDKMSNEKIFGTDSCLSCWDFGESLIS